MQCNYFTDKYLGRQLPARACLDIYIYIIISPVRVLYLDEYFH